MQRRVWLWVIISMFVLVDCTMLATKVCFGQPPADSPPEQKELRLREEGRKGKLGVYTRPQANGELILQVRENTPASKAGLEPGDVIVSVDGFTVGIIDGLVYPLQSEIRRVKRAGEFKIINGRTGEVVTKKIVINPDDKEG